jgi:multiple sugar transport system permease protein
MGYGSALAWVLFIIVLVLTIFLFATSGRWIYYAGEGRK